MYLARLSDGDTELVQGGVRLSYPAPAATRIAGYGSSDYWFDSLRALARGATSVAPLSLSLRVRLSERGHLSACIGVLAEGAREPVIRRWLAGYTRLERVVSDSSSLPVSREDFDGLFGVGDAPNDALRVARVSAPDYRRQDLWVACDFQLLPHLGDLLLEARQLGHPLVAQINLTNFAASEDQVREARRNVVRLGESGRAPAGLLELQNRLARRVADASYVLEEYVGTSATGVDDWLRAALAQRFSRQFSGLPFDAPVHAFTPAPSVAGLDPPLHSSLLDPDAVSVADLCATADDAGVLERVLAWVPPDALRFTPPADAPDEAAIAPNVLPPTIPSATDRADDYLFISYSHSDAPRIAPHVRALHDSAIPFWYDAGIPSGAEWDSVIESRIEKCRALVLFLSARAVASKYVRREVKFADALDKPLVSIVLEPVALREGLRMLLTQYQMVDAAAPDIAAAVRQAMS